MGRIHLGSPGRGRNFTDWHPVAVRDEQDVERLNGLFRKGWYLQGVDLDGLPCLAFSVSMSGVASPRTPTSFSLEKETDGDHVLILVLSRGRIKGRQRALMIKPDERGYFDFARVRDDLVQEGEGWGVSITFTMEGHRMLAVLERL